MDDEEVGAGCLSMIVAVTVGAGMKWIFDRFVLRFKEEE